MLFDTDRRRNPNPLQIRARIAPARLSLQVLSGKMVRKPHALDMRPALGFVIILERDAEEREYRYRLFGSSIARASGFDMTGKLMSEHPASRHATEFAIASTVACARQGLPLYTERQPARAEMTTRWSRLRAKR